MNYKNNKGIALVFSLLMAVVLIGLSSLFVLRTVHENRMAKMEANLSKALAAANGSAHMALDSLDNLINNFLLNTVSSANPSGVLNYTSQKVHQKKSLEWLLYAVRDNGTPVLTDNDIQAEYAQSGTLNNSSYQYNIIITQKKDPETITSDMWDLFYNYRIESSATLEGITQESIITGDFTVRVQRDNFAKYALFTNRQEMPDGTEVWFTDKTNFAGPLHTNDRYNFALNPSGTFNGLVKQVEQRARFYDDGTPVLLDDDHNGIKDVPTFNAGFERDAESIALASPTQKDDMIEQATGGQSFSTEGIYLPNDGTNVTGGIYMRGNGRIDMTVDGNNNAVYIMNRGTIKRNITLDRTNLQTTILDPDSGASQTYTGLPDGLDDVGTIIYVDGRINSLKGTVQKDEEVTIASDNDIVITDHIHYTDYTPDTGTPGQPGYIPPSAEGTTNLLGLVAWDGDVRIGTSAPDDVDVHGTILTKNGIFTVDDYDNTGVGPRGTATLLGGVISDDYGAFGLFSGATGNPLSGYGRNFVYDQRMLTAGKAPPYFPSLRTFIAFTNDITDKIIWQGGSR